MSINRPAGPVLWPLTEPSTDAGKEAKQLHAAWVEKFGWVEKVEADYAKASAARREAEAALGQARSPKAQGQAEAAYNKAKEALEGPWVARLEGPARASEDARAAFLEHVDDSLEELLSEPQLAEAAEVAREQMLGTVEALVSQVERWDAAHRDYFDVLRLAERIEPNATLPRLPDSLRELARNAEGVL